ncbi:hypothetical protein [Bacillus pinisoli]|uniref:hypothetical protein n=1 Tax=Bacillus pinisoli TaxID=2901866 RepID=UPI001FF576F3|nr:hypothetical protein [Bacillus pinisoli]
MNKTFTLTSILDSKDRNSYVNNLENNKDDLIQLLDYLDALNSHDRDEIKNLNILYSIVGIDIKIAILKKVIRLVNIEDRFFTLDYFFEQENLIEQDVKEYKFSINKSLSEAFPGLKFLIMYNDNIPINKEVMKNLMDIHSLVNRFNNDLLKKTIHKNLEVIWDNIREFLITENNEEMLENVFKFIDVFSGNSNIRTKLTKQQQYMYTSFKVGRSLNKVNLNEDTNEVVNKVNEHPKEVVSRENLNEDIKDIVNKISPNDNTNGVVNKVEEVYDENINNDHNKDFANLKDYNGFKVYLINNLMKISEEDLKNIFNKMESFTIGEKRELTFLLLLAMDNIIKEKTLLFLVNDGIAEFLPTKDILKLVLHFEDSLDKKLELIRNISNNKNNILLFDVILDNVREPILGLKYVSQHDEDTFINYCISRTNNTNEVLLLCESIVNHNKFNIWERLKVSFLEKAMSHTDTVFNKIDFVKQTGLLRENDQKIRLLVYNKLFMLESDLCSAIDLVLDNMDYPEDIFIFLDGLYKTLDEEAKKVLLKYVTKVLKEDQEAYIIKSNLRKSKDNEFTSDYILNAYKSLKENYESMKFSNVNEVTVREDNTLNITKGLTNFINKFELRLVDYQKDDIEKEYIIEELKAFKHLLRNSLEDVGIKPLIPLDKDNVNYHYRHHEPHNSYRQPSEGELCSVITHGLKVVYKGVDEVISLAKVDIEVDHNE